jgi:hypothetical protein
MATNRYCDGITRRDFVKVGALGGLGLSLASYLRMAKAGEIEGAKAQSAIFIYLGGGPSHMDTFDLKPDAPEEYRGEFKPIATNVSGVQISEHLPKLAACADKFAIVRGVSHSLAAHGPGTAYMNTGNIPNPALEYPSYGAVVTKELPSAKDLPPFVAIPNSPQKPGYLGVKYAPLQTNASPTAGKPFPLRGITLGDGLTITALEKRTHLLHDLDTAFKEHDLKSDLLDGLDQFKDKAFSIISSPRCRKAFDLSQESAKTAEAFGTNAFGQSCLLAGRLVEAGVRFTTITLGGWDTHAQNFANLKGGAPRGGKGAVGLLPTLDAGLAALFGWLADRGLLATTAVFVTGEFGRTPKINRNAGRDHWSRAMFVLLGGGGFSGGQVVGASDARGEGPAVGDGFKPEDVAATFYHNLGINHTKEYHTSTGRPVMIVREAKLIRQLVG